MGVRELGNCCMCSVTTYILCPWTKIFYFSFRKLLEALKKGYRFTTAVKMRLAGEWASRSLQWIATFALDGTGNI